MLFQSLIKLPPELKRQEPNLYELTLSSAAFAVGLFEPLAGQSLRHGFSESGHWQINCWQPGQPEPYFL